MIAIAALCAFAGGVAGTWTARRIAWRIGLVSRPNPIVPQHVTSVAYLGGIGVALGLLVGAAVVAASGSPIAPSLLGGTLAFTALGTVDDVRAFRPSHKLGLQIAIAAAYAWHGSDGPVELVLAVLWLVTIVNAVNLTDVCDGLVAGLSIACAVAVACVAEPELATVVAAATAGCLLFNRPPASIFLGDCGSHLLGFALGACWLAAWRADPSWTRAGAAVLGLGVFLLELGFLVVVRWRRGIPFWRGSPDHLALRLQAAGCTKQQTLAIALVPTIVLSGLALWLVEGAGIAAILGGAVIGVLVHLVARLYAREPVPRAGQPREENLA